MQEIFNLIQIRTLYKQEDKTYLVDKLDSLIEMFIDNIIKEIKEDDKETSRKEN